MKATFRPYAVSTTGLSAERIAALEANPGLGRWIVRLTDDWLPLPDYVLATLGWTEGDRIEIEAVEGTLICTRADQNK